MNPETQEQSEARVMQYARQMHIDEITALMMYRNLAFKNRRRAYERTIEYIFEANERRKD